MWICARNKADVIDALEILSKGSARVIGGAADVTDDLVFRGWMSNHRGLGCLDILVECKLLVAGADEAAAGGA